MAKYLDQSGSKRLVDNLKASQSTLNTKINSEIVARENFATDATSSISALDTKIDDRIQTIALDGTTLSITSGAGTTDTYRIQDTTYNLATATDAGLMSASDKTKLDGLTDYSLPTASKTTKGGVKIGDGLVMNGDTLSCSGDFSSICVEIDSIKSFGASIDVSASDFDAWSSNIAVSHSTIGADESEISVYKSTLAAFQASIDADEASISGNPTFSGTPYFSGIPVFAQVPNIAVATSISAGLMNSTDKAKLDNLALITTAGNGVTISGGTITSSEYTLPTATASTLGGVKIGNGLSVSNGVISVPMVTSSANGLMSASDKTKLDGIANNANNYTLPTASTSTKGGIIVGDGLAMNGDTLNVTVSGDTVSRSDEFTNQVTLNGGFYSRFAQSDLSNSSIKADFATLDAQMSTIGVSSSTLTAGLSRIDLTTSQIYPYNVTISGDLTTGTDGHLNLSGNFCARSVSSDLSYSAINAEGASISGNLTFSGNQTLSGGLCARSIKSDLSNSSIKADFATLDAQMSTIGVSFSTLTAGLSRIDLTTSQIYLYNVTISGNPTFTGEVTFDEPIYIDNTGSTVKGALCFDVENNLPRLKLRMNGVDYIFNCDTSVTGGTG